VYEKDKEENRGGERKLSPVCVAQTPPFLFEVAYHMTHFTLAPADIASFFSAINDMMNATFADAIWKRRFDESERQRRVGDLHVRLLQFCLEIKPPDASTDLSGIIDAFYESSRRFFESVRGRTGLGHQILHNMLQDAKPIAEHDFSRVVAKPHQITFPEALAYLRDAGVPALPVAPTKGPESTLAVDLELLTKALLTIAKCQELSDVPKGVNVDFATFEGNTAFVARVEMNMRSVDPSVFEDMAKNVRVEGAVGWNDVSLGCYLLKAYIDTLGGTVLPGERSVDIVVPSMADTRFGAPVGRREEPVRRQEPMQREEPVRREEPTRREEPARRQEPMQREEPVRREEPTRREEPARREELRRTPTLAVERQRTPSPRPVSVKSFTTETPEKSLAGKTLNILLVDDNPINLRILQRLLDGHNVATASNGPDAIETFRKQYFSIVFLDIVLPNDVSGIDVARQMNEIQAERKRAPVPIVAVTGHKVEDYAIDAARAGIKEFLTKPVSRGTLTGILVKYCG